MGGHSKGIASQGCPGLQEGAQPSLPHPRTA